MIVTSMHLITSSRRDIAVLQKESSALEGEEDVKSCHNAIWEQAAALIKADVNPDKLSHEALAAELTNHLVAGVVLIPGAAATMPELQRVGFHYAK
jgi:hypothetical protein